jgi:hypothetical protein
MLQKDTCIINVILTNLVTQEHGILVQYQNYEKFIKKNSMDALTNQ